MKTPAGWLRRIIKFFSSSISNRIIIPYVLLTLVLAAFGTFVVTYLVAGSIEERFRNQLFSAGRIVSDEVVNRENVRLEVERVAAGTQGVPQALIDRNLTNLDNLVMPIAVNSKAIDSLILLDAQGKEVVRFQRNLGDVGGVMQVNHELGIDFFGFRSVSQVLADPQGAWKDVDILRDPQSNELLIYTAGPVRAERGTVGAVLVGTYLKSDLTMLKSLALADITLFDKQANVIGSTLVTDPGEAAKVFSSFTSKRFQQVVDQAKEVVFLEEIQNTDTDKKEVTAWGQTYRLAYAPFILRSQVYGVYAVALPTNFITETNDSSRFWLAGVFNAGVMAVRGIGYVVSRRIIKPIISLVQTSQDIASGNLDRRTGLKSDDEIGTLARTFDNMTSALQRKTVELREEASKLNAILNSIADGVIVQDMEGNIITTNPAAEAILESIGHSIRPTNGDTSSEQARSLQLLPDLTGLQFHESSRFNVGRQVLSALSAPVLGGAGEQLGTVIVLRDITREVEAERLKDDFITSMSHELRTPPTAIKGYNDLLKMVAASKLSPRELSFIEAIDQNVTDLLNIIQQMLDLSQIDAGTLGIDQALQNLPELVAAEAATWHEQMKDKELTLTVQSPVEPLWVVGDASRLTQVVHNLLSNAYNYTRPGGQVEVIVSQTEGQVQVEVKDTGVGITFEDQRFLFTRFFRAIHEESTFEVSGAGLGLYMSKAIIEAHQGKIWIQSELNQGSTFSFALPLADPALLDSPGEDEWEKEPEAATWQ